MGAGADPARLSGTWPSAREIDWRTIARSSSSSIGFTSHHQPEGFAPPDPIAPMARSPRSEIGVKLDLVDDPDDRGVHGRRLPAERVPRRFAFDHH
jgi:hypothetical protein